MTKPEATSEPGGPAEVHTFQPGDIVWVTDDGTPTAAIVTEVTGNGTLRLEARKRVGGEDLVKRWQFPSGWALRDVEAMSGNMRGNFRTPVRLLIEDALMTANSGPRLDRETAEKAARAILARLTSYRRTFIATEDLDELICSASKHDPQAGKPVATSPCGRCLQRRPLFRKDEDWGAKVPDLLCTVCWQKFAALRAEDDYIDFADAFDNAPDHVLEKALGDGDA